MYFCLSQKCARCRHFLLAPNQRGELNRQFVFGDLPRPCWVFERKGWGQEKLTFAINGVRGYLRSTPIRLIQVCLCTIVVFALIIENCCCCVEPLKRQILGLAKVDFAEPTRTLAIGIPVPALPFTLTPGCECTQRVPKRKGLIMLIHQPGVPGVRSNNDWNWLIFYSIEPEYSVGGDQCRAIACHRVILVWLGNARHSMSYVTPQVYHGLGNVSTLSARSSIVDKQGAMSYDNGVPAMGHQ